MNDRFKFRIWDKKLKKLAKWGDNPYHNMEIMNYICVENPVTDWKHEDYILMQCTGLKDKNGKLIYESDYVRYAKNKYKVEIDKFLGISLTNILNGDTIIMDDIVLFNCEVIGNEFESNTKI